MRILLTGRTGQIGYELTRCLPGAATAEVIAPDRNVLDLARPDTIQRVVRDVRPDVVINAAAYTDVEGAEDEPELADAINGVAPGVLAEEARRLGAAFVHYSTDYVFDGRASTPYEPSAVPNPLNAYGRSKLAGETAVASTGVTAIVLRTSWIYGTRRPSFFSAILDRAERQSTLDVVDDQHGCPTWCRRVAEATAWIVATALQREGRRWSWGDRSGIHHLAAAGSATWCDFARAIVAAHDVHPKPVINPVPSSVWPTRAARPAYSVLGCEATRRAFAIQLGPWRDGLGAALAGDEPLRAAA